MQQFGRLKVIRRFTERIPRTDRKDSFRDWVMVDARCDCDGNVKTYRLSHLESGAIQSCGCLRRELVSKRFSTHKLSAHVMSGTHKLMMDRCYNPNNPAFKRYGGDGITVEYKLWHTLRGFCDWYDALPANRKRKPGETLHRIDNNRGYSPNNCMFASYKIQNREKRNTHKHVFRGKLVALADIFDVGRREGRIPQEMAYQTFKSRVLRGSTLKEAASKPIKVKSK